MAGKIYGWKRKRLVQELYEAFRSNRQNQFVGAMPALMAMRATMMQVM